MVRPTLIRKFPREAHRAIARTLPAPADSGPGEHRGLTIVTFVHQPNSVPRLAVRVAGKRP
jgi:hypothetical protein